jgi:hypothetical protein
MLVSLTIGRALSQRERPYCFSPSPAMEDCMLSVTLLSLVCATVEPAWHTDYDQAASLATKEKKDLVIFFREDDQLDETLKDEEVRKPLADYVCLRVPASYEYGGQRLLEHSALDEMMGKPGLAVVSFHDSASPTYRQVISAHPLVGSRYRWVPDYGPKEIAAILDLPPQATLSQRSMIYAIRVHPERPRSVLGKLHGAFLGHAERHSQRQAATQRQHHADIIAASQRMAAESGESVGASSEVVAESWGRVVGGENVLEAAFSCVDAWRHSSAHWSAVSRLHRFFGYDIARGANSTWYATGIFGE